MICRLRDRIFTVRLTGHSAYKRAPLSLFLHIYIYFLNFTFPRGVSKGDIEFRPWPRSLRVTVLEVTATPAPPESIRALIC